jgi:CBS domain-containing protein
MTVGKILSHKGSNVTTTTPTATLETGIRVLTECGIGALVVLGADERVIGILSERDIVRALAERGPSALREPLACAMARNVSTCTQSETVYSIMERMTVGRFRHMPVVEEERPVGIVSIGDVVKHRVMELQRETEMLQQEREALQHETEVLHHETEVLHHETEVLQHETEELRNYIQSA